MIAHEAVSRAASLYNDSAQLGVVVESHFCVASDGALVQYIDPAPFRSRRGPTPVASTALERGAARDAAAANLEPLSHLVVTEAARSGEGVDEPLPGQVERPRVVAIMLAGRESRYVAIFPSNCR
ncbi:hypothetical protein ABTZ99_11805 [Actinosynnema sp. NPDC002837]